MGFKVLRDKIYIQTWTPSLKTDWYRLRQCDCSESFTSTISSSVCKKSCDSFTIIWSKCEQNFTSKFKIHTYIIAFPYKMVQQSKNQVDRLHWWGKCVLDMSCIIVAILGGHHVPYIWQPRFLYQDKVKGEPKLPSKL